MSLLKGMPSKRIGKFSKIDEPNTAGGFQRNAIQGILSNQASDLAANAIQGGQLRYFFTGSEFIPFLKVIALRRLELVFR